MDLYINTQGLIRAIYGEALPFQSLGIVQIQRASALLDLRDFIHHREAGIIFRFARLNRFALDASLPRLSKDLGRVRVPP